jgi:hypothetical protein
MAVKQLKKAISWFNGRHHDAKNLPISSRQMCEDVQIEIPGGLEGIRQRMAAMGHVPIGPDIRPAQVTKNEDHAPNYTENNYHQNPATQQQQVPPKPRRKPAQQKPIVYRPHEGTRPVEAAPEGRICSSIQLHRIYLVDFLLLQLLL